MNLAALAQALGLAHPLDSLPTPSLAATHLERLALPAADCLFGADCAATAS